MSELSAVRSATTCCISLIACHMIDEQVIGYFYIVVSAPRVNQCTYSPDDGQTFLI